jgi:hypothetical protein
LYGCILFTVQIITVLDAEYLDLSEDCIVKKKRRDQLTMSYFDNLDNKPLNKYKKKKLMHEKDAFYIV